MSPEQAAGQPVIDPRSDIYSLGATLYELLTQQPAFPGSDRREIASYHAHFPGASAEELFEKHQAGVAKRTRGDVKPTEHPHDLAALAARIDEFLVRSAA